MEFGKLAFYIFNETNIIMNQNKFIISENKKIYGLKTKNSWINYLKNKNNLGHVERVLISNNLKNHIFECLNSSYKSILRINNDTKIFKPKYILEIGSSVGFICMQAKNFFPDAEVIGIEPEKQAVEVASNMSKDFKLKRSPLENTFQGPWVRPWRDLLSRTRRSLEGEWKEPTHEQVEMPRGRRWRRRRKNFPPPPAPPPSRPGIQYPVRLPPHSD